MLQRIGLAQALIGDPQLVILDEPQSGLDPIGRRDVADIIREAQNQGKTVFFSSHILPDVERLCDRVGVIRNGKMEVVGSLNQLLKNQQSVEIVVMGNASEAWRQKMKAIPGVSLVSRGEQHTITVQGDVVINDMLTAAIADGLRVEHVMQRRDDLEAFFMQDVQKNDSAQKVQQDNSEKEVQQDNSEKEVQTDSPKQEVQQDNSEKEE